MWCSPARRERRFCRRSNVSEISRRSSASWRDRFAKSTWRARSSDAESNWASMRLRRIKMAVSAWARARFAWHRAFRTREPIRSIRARTLGRRAVSSAKYRISNFSNSVTQASARATSARADRTASQSIEALDSRARTGFRSGPRPVASMIARKRPSAARIRAIPERGDMAAREVACARLSLARRQIHTEPAVGIC